jgi:uncharacterized spore protein YtfJ
VDKGLRRLIDAVSSTKLVYGEPIREGDRTIIPVARVRVSGGWGFGKGDRSKGQVESGIGSGGGGSLDAAPAGFIEVAPDGARFHEIADPERTGRLLKAGAAALATVVTGFAGARRLRKGAGPTRLLGRGR